MISDWKEGVTHGCLLRTEILPLICPAVSLTPRRLNFAKSRGFPSFFRESFPILHSSYVDILMLPARLDGVDFEALYFVKLT